MNANKNLEIVLYIALGLSTSIILAKLPLLYLALPAVIFFLSLASAKIANGFVNIMKAFITFILQIFVKIFITLSFFAFLFPIVFIQGLIQKAKLQRNKDFRTA
jgi:hypothetical protein